MMGMLLSCGQTDVLALLADVLEARYAWFPSFLTFHQRMAAVCFFLAPHTKPASSCALSTDGDKESLSQWCERVPPLTDGLPITRNDGNAVELWADRCACFVGRCT